MSVKFPQLLCIIMVNKMKNSFMETQLWLVRWRFHWKGMMFETWFINESKNQKKKKGSNNILKFYKVLAKQNMLTKVLVLAYFFANTPALSVNVHIYTTTVLKQFISFLNVTL